MGGIETDPGNSHLVPSDAKFSGKWIAVATSDEAVRARPRMYFGLGRSSPWLPAAVARAVAAEPFGWSHNPVNVELRLESDLAFTVLDDGAVPCFGLDRLPLLDDRGCLLDRRRWALSAAASLSARTFIEIRASERLWRQTLSGTTADTAPQDCGPCDGPLTRITFELDGQYFRPGAVLPADTAWLWPDVPRQVRGTFRVTDLRTADTSPPGP
jgi:hypothetical protein